MQKKKKKVFLNIAERNIVLTLPFEEFCSDSPPLEARRIQENRYKYMYIKEESHRA